MCKWFLLVAGVVSAFPGFSADVLFGRRVYALQERTYQQIWKLDARTNKTAALSNTKRRHVQPVCSVSGKRIWFLSGAFGDPQNNELWWFDPHARTEKLAFQFKGDLVRLLGGTEFQVFFIAMKSDVFELYRWDGKLTKLAAVANPDAAALSPDIRSIAVGAGESGSVTMMDAIGRAGRMVKNCAGPVWSADGKKLACHAGKNIRVLNLTTGNETANAEFAERTTNPEVADFSADGTRLLVKTVGANHNSTYPQSDYWVLEIATDKWTFVAPGQAAIFASGNRVLLVTPRELSPMSKGQEWTSQMLLIDPKTHAQTPVAGGKASQAEPSRCAHPL